MPTPAELITLLEAPPVAGEPAAVAVARRFLEGDRPPEATLPADVAGALVELLVRRGDAARLERLAAAPDKATAKQARRGIHLLRSRGVKAALPVPQAAAPRPWQSEAAEPEPPSLASAPLQAGQRMIWLARVAADGLEVFQAELSEERGLTRLETYGVSRKQWRAVERSLAAQGDLCLARVPGHHARWLLEEAHDQALAAGRVPPREYAEMRHRMGPVEPPARHPAEELVPEAAVAAAGPPEGAVALPEARTWIPDEPAVRGIMAELARVAESALVVDPRTRDEQIEELVRRARVEALGGPWRRRLVRRLLDMAYVVLRAEETGPPGRDYRADAALCVAAARHVADESVPPEENRVARALFARVTGPRPAPGAATDGSGGTGAPESTLLEPPPGGGLIVPP